MRSLRVPHLRNRVPGLDEACGIGWSHLPVSGQQQLRDEEQISFQVRILGSHRLQLIETAEDLRGSHVPHYLRAAFDHFVIAACP
jgi:hypothetical protein